MMQYEKYQQYRDSGVEWIGEVPGHWSISKLKYMSVYRNGYAFKSDDYVEDGIPIIRIGDIKEEINLDSTKKIPIEFLPEVKSFLIKKWDILIALTGATIGKSCIYNIDDIALLNQRVGAITAKENQKYLYYYISSDIFKKYVTLLCDGGAQENIGKNEIGSLAIPQFSYGEQTQIANFLDQKTAEIDSLIADKEKLISLLEEQRQAIITEAVTKGLDPNVKMKDSGVEWIGEIPDEWDVKRLKDSCIINPNKSELKVNDDIEVTFLPMENIISSGVIDTSITKNISEVYSGYTYFREEDIIVAKVTPCFENGNISIAYGLSNGIGFGTTELHVLRSKDKFDNRFIFYVLQSNRFKLEGIASMYGVAGLKRIPTEFVQNFKFAVPAIEEQKEIANFIDKKIKEISQIKNEIVLQINKLKEYRQSLIFEAVTGKIDVRNVAAEKI